MSTRIKSVIDMLC